MIKDLFPFRINRAVIRNGSIHFRAFQSERTGRHLPFAGASDDRQPREYRDEMKPLVCDSADDRADDGPGEV
jgi:hypothetical protein